VFSREFFHQLEDEINRARYEIDEKYHMGQDLRLGKDIIEQPMTTPLDRLKGKFLQARGVAHRVAGHMESEADFMIAEEEAIKAETVAAFAPHKAILSEGRNELKQIKDALGLMSNGGPALDPLSASENTEPGS
jgi:hypothetical protein